MARRRPLSRGCQVRLSEYLQARYLPERFLSDGWAEQLQVAVRLYEAYAGASAARVGNLSETAVIAWLRSYSGHVAARTVNSKRCALLALWRAAAADGLCRPPGLIPKMREPLHLPEAWSLQEFERLLRAASLEPGVIDGIDACRWWPALLLTLFDTAGRIGAIIRVRAADLLLDQRALILRAENQKQRRDQFCRLSDQTVAALAATGLPAASVRALVFPWPWRRETLFARLRKIARRANVRHGRGAGGLFHRIRRTSATLVYCNGGDAAKHLGHASAAVTMKHYIDPRMIADGEVDRLPRPKF